MRLQNLLTDDDPTPVHAPVVGFHARAVAIEVALAPLADVVVNHPLLLRLHEPLALRRFCEHLVFTVWDEMSLLKGLQRRLTCTSVPWMPLPAASPARFVNGFLSAAEHDDTPEGGCASHFELFLQAMAALGADTAPMARLSGLLAEGQPALRALSLAAIPPAAAGFVSRTLETCVLRRTHELAASYALCRLKVVAAVYEQLLLSLGGARAPAHGALVYFIDRALGARSRSGESGLLLLSDLCGEEQLAWEEAEACAAASLREWALLFDAIDDGLREETRRVASGGSATPGG